MKPKTQKKTGRVDWTKYFQAGSWGAVGFVVGSLVANLLIRTWFYSAGFSYVFNSIDQAQVFQRFWAVLILAMAGLALGGVVTGGLGGCLIYRGTGKKKAHRSWWWKSGISFGVAQALLIIPMLLLIIFIARYNQGYESGFTNILLLFGLYGLVYGLVAGGILGLLTKGWRSFWQVMIGTTVGFGLGGVGLGLTIYWLASMSLRGEKVETWMGGVVLMIGLLILNLFGGIGTGMGLVWPEVKINYSGQVGSWWVKYRRIIGLVVVGLVFMKLWGASSQIMDFVAIRPASLASQLSLPTEGMGWSEPELVEGNLGSLIKQRVGQVEVSGNQKDGPHELCQSRCVSQVDIFTSGDRQVAVWLNKWVEESRQEVEGVYYIMVSENNGGKWTRPVVVGASSQLVQPVGVDNNGPVVGWVEEDGVLAVRQYEYSCQPESLSPVGQAIYALVQENGFWSDEELPYCNNMYSRLVYMPNPKEEYSEWESNADGGFSVINEALGEARYEVLFVTMEWQETLNQDSPGAVLAGEVVKLYEKVRSEPEKYPRGMKVKILLGNYPVMADFEYGSQIWHVMNDLREAGLPKLVDEAVGFEVAVANFEGAMPHAHTKFMVVDGKTLMAGGFNYGYLHFPADHRSGQGYNLEDLGLAMAGPVAQMGLAVYDDMWEGANQIKCDDFEPSVLNLWQIGCQEVKAEVDHPPEVVRLYVPPEGKAEAFSLSRNEVYKEGDVVIKALVAGAEESVDLFEVNFSMEMICGLSVILPDICTFEKNRLPFMEAVVEAVENGAKVRVLVERSNMNGIENLIGTKFLMRELGGRGLTDMVEVKFFDGKMHDKAVLVDGKILVVGSQNFHYSAWGKTGLAEYSVATNDETAIEDFSKMYEYHWERGEVVQSKDQLTSTP